MYLYRHHDQGQQISFWLCRGLHPHTEHDVYQHYYPPLWCTGNSCQKTNVSTANNTGTSLREQRIKMRRKPQIPTQEYSGTWKKSLLKKILLKIIKTTDTSGSEEGQHAGSSTYSSAHFNIPKREITPLKSRYIIVLLRTLPTKWQ